MLFCVRRDKEQLHLTVIIKVEYFDQNLFYLMFIYTGTRVRILAHSNIYSLS